jgi:hypothetical protein
MFAAEPVSRHRVVSVVWLLPAGAGGECAAESFCKASGKDGLPSVDSKVGMLLDSLPLMNFQVTNSHQSHQKWIRVAVSSCFSKGPTLS